MTAPLPPIATDPSIVAGNEVKGAFTAQSQAARQDWAISDLAKAERIDALWTAANAEISRLYLDLVARRRARLAELEALVPLGPGIPADSSPADAAVLSQAFRAALAQSRQASPAELAAQLADATAFNDDNLLRATLTAASEGSNRGLIDQWAAQVGLSDQVAEITDLQTVVAGQSFTEHAFEMQALSPIATPDEVTWLSSADTQAAMRLR